MKKKGKECLHCHKIFIPDRYNHHFQKYCTAKECRHASRLASRRVYRNKPKNKTPEKRIIESERVLKWQKLHPKYWKNKKRFKKNNDKTVLRDIAQVENALQNSIVLRDIAQLQTTVSDLTQVIDNVRYQECVIAGLTTTLTGSVLRDIIEDHLDRFYDIGNKLLVNKTESAFINIVNKRSKADEEQSSYQSPKKTQNPQTLQLGGSSSG